MFNRLGCNILCGRAGRNDRKDRSSDGEAPLAANQGGVLRRAVNKQRVHDTSPHSTISIIAEPARSRRVVPSGRSAVGQALIGHPQTLIVAGMTRMDLSSS